MRADRSSTSLLRAGLIALAMAPLAACDTISSLNPFDKPEVYKPEIKQTLPAEQLYNEGLAFIDKKEFEGAKALQ